MFSPSDRVHKVTVILLLVNVTFFFLSNISFAFYGTMVQVNVLVFSGQVHRLFTAMFMHKDILHLGSNMVFLFLFGNSVEKTHGWRQLLAIYILSGLAGNIASLFFLPCYSISLGASGAIFGLLACMFTYDKGSIFISLVFILMFVVLSIGTNINTWAHLTGAIIGFIYAYFLNQRRMKYILGEN